MIFTLSLLCIIILNFIFGTVDGHSLEFRDEWSGGGGIGHQNKQSAFCLGFLSTIFRDVWEWYVDVDSDGTLAWLADWPTGSLCDVLELPFFLNCTPRSPSVSFFGSCCVFLFCIKTDHHFFCDSFTNCKNCCLCWSFYQSYHYWHHAKYKNKTQWS